MMATLEKEERTTDLRALPALLECLFLRPRANAYEKSDFSWTMTPDALKGE
jgi:hypothetical protein